MRMTQGQTVLLLVACLGLLLTSTPTLAQEPEKTSSPHHYHQDDPFEFIQVIEEEGYVGTIRVRITINREDAVITKVEILDHTETRGYGSYVTEEWFLKRFVDKDATTLLELVKMINREPNEVVAITGATITSQAVLQAVNAAIERFVQTLDEEDPSLLAHDEEMCS